MKTSSFSLPWDLALLKLPSNSFGVALSLEVSLSLFISTRNQHLPMLAQDIVTDMNTLMMVIGEKFIIMSYIIVFIK
jgi:hypothetical protein